MSWRAKRLLELVRMGAGLDNARCEFSKMLFVSRTSGCQTSSTWKSCERRREEFRKNRI